MGDTSAGRGPFVVAHVAVSVDGATTGFEPDVGRFYELAATWDEDVTLVGADTILAQEEALATAPRPGPATDGPLLAVVDGRGRVRQWDALRDAGHWSGVLALHAATTPPRPPDRDVPELVVGADRVDLTAATRVLGERGASVIRVDSGGALLGAMLAEGLVAELSLLVHPCFVGRQATQRWYGTELFAPGTLRLVASQALDGGLVWLRYGIGTTATLARNSASA